MHVIVTYTTAPENDPTVREFDLSDNNGFNDYTWLVHLLSTKDISFEVTTATDNHKF